jgi:outer membrane protein
MKLTKKTGIALRTLAGIAVVALIAPVAAANIENPWLVRVRAIEVTPDESSTISVIGGSAEVDDSIAPELDISYFFSDHWAAELVLTLSPHDVSAKNTAAGDVDLGDVWLLPPCLSLQYHLLPENKIRPYVGAGVNLTLFLDEDPGPVATSIDYDDALGFVLGAGIDFDLNDQWCLNVDIKKVYLSTDATIKVPGVAGDVVADVDIDPWILGVGLGYKF